MALSVVTSLEARFWVCRQLRVRCAPGGGVFHFPVVTHLRGGLVSSSTRRVLHVVQFVWQVNALDLGELRPILMALLLNSSVVPSLGNLIPKTSIFDVMRDVGGCIGPWVVFLVRWSCSTFCLFVSYSIVHACFWVSSSTLPMVRRPSIQGGRACVPSFGGGYNGNVMLHRPDPFSMA